MIVAMPRARDPEKVPAGGRSCCSAATWPWRLLIEADRVSMSFAKSVVVGSAMGDDMWAVEDEGEVGIGGMVAAGWTGGGAAEEEDRLEADTRLSRAWAPRVAGPLLLSSY